MRVLHQDAKAGELKLLPESIDDLWHLYNLVEPGDLVFAWTSRREETPSDKLRAERGEKRAMRLGIRVEKLEFKEFDDRLRILGTIEVGPQDHGAHHTLLLAPGEDLSIIKERWARGHLERVQRAVEASRMPLVTLAAIEDAEATLAVLRQHGVQQLVTISRVGGGKRVEDAGASAAFLAEVAEKLLAAAGEQPVVILGPGFAKEALLERLRERSTDVARRTTVISTGQAGMAGITEALKRGLGGRILEETRLGYESRLVEQLFNEIATSGKCTYGLAQVKEAAALGAVETLLVLDALVHSAEIDALIREVEQRRGTLAIISRLHDAGRMLDSLGGIAAILRFAVGHLESEQLRALEERGS